jgi:predicted nucleic acid-binding protein
VRSLATDAELREVLARPGLFAVPEQKQADLLRQWAAQALLVPEVAPVAFRCRDPLDQKFVELAVTAGARWLVSRDKALLKLRRKAARLGCAVVTPEGFTAAAGEPACATAGGCATLVADWRNGGRPGFP